MRFDDTLETVLAADLDTPFGVQSLWRQLVDLVGRRRVAADARAMATLRSIRDRVPAPIRSASARALEMANPPAPLVRLFALDELAIAIPVLRSARLNSSEWIQLLPELSPPARSVLRNRRDLGPVVKRALDSFGAIDLVLPDGTPKPQAQDESPAVVTNDSADPAPDETPLAAPAAMEDVLGPEPLPEEQEAVAAPAPAEAVEPEPLAIEAAPAPEPVAEVASPTSPLALAELLDALEARSLAAPAVEAQSGTEPDAGEAVPEPAPDSPIALSVAEPEPEVLPDPIAPFADAAEDYSFVALALGGLEAAPPARAVEPAPIVADPVQSGTVEPDPAPEPVAEPPLASQTYAMRESELLTISDSATPAAGDPPLLPVDIGGSDEEGVFEIAEVVARIDAFWRDREEKGPPPPKPRATGDQFRFETDAKGVIRWVEGVSRAPIIGLSLDVQGMAAGSRVDGGATGAFRRRAGFTNARLVIEGESDAAGDWLISGVPAFDPANGRFTGYRGTARRPRADERAEPLRTPPGGTPAESLRQLVHELRTPTNAIAGFAEMIETQMLGPVSDPYRDRATVIRTQAKELLGAIDDLDLAARIDSAALSLQPGMVALRPLLAGIADDLAQLSELRGSIIALPIEDLAVVGDRRAVERLLARLMATLVSASGPGERVGIHVAREGDELVAITIDRPQALADYPGDSVLGIDDEREDATLLGTGFALRLARNLARELGGSLVIAPETLTLRLPAAVTGAMDQAHLN